MLSLLDLDSVLLEEKKRPAKVGKTHKISKEDSIKWFIDNFEGIVVRPKQKQAIVAKEQQ